MVLQMTILQHFKLIFELLALSNRGKGSFGRISFGVDSLRSRPLRLVFLQFGVDGGSEWLEVVLLAFGLHLGQIEESLLFQITHAIYN